VVVGDEKVTVVLVLELYPVLERTVVIAEMQAARRAHPGEDSARRDCGRAQKLALRIFDDLIV
jgi:hypothetical protein